MATSELRCRVVAEREPASRVWQFHLVNDGAAAIESATLVAVRYEWGDQYVGGESPDARVAGLAPGQRALVWRDDGGSETRVDLWLRIDQGQAETWLLFEFPKLYRQTGTVLVAEATRVSRPSGGIP